MAVILLVIIYLASIGLGLPDSLLGAAWPAMYGQLQVPVSYMGMISMVVAVGTIISSLNGAKLISRFGSGAVTAISVAMTALAIWGFSISSSFGHLCLWAIPYGLGAGSVDAALNNYVAIHYPSRHMSWIHCMWGVGTIIGPYAIGLGITAKSGWNWGYRLVFCIQVVLTILLFISLPLWKATSIKSSEKAPEDQKGTQSLRQLLRIPGVKQDILVFFTYMALEGTTMLWASSFMVLHSGLSEDTAAKYASLFFIGITAGRAANGFLTIKFSDRQLIYAGQSMIALGIIALIVSKGSIMTVTGLVMIGLGCAPIHPCMLHSTSAYFGEDRSQALMGLQIASGYTGNCLMPPLFGLIANHVSAALFPFYLCGLLAVMVIMHRWLVRKTEHRMKSLPTQ